MSNLACCGIANCMVEACQNSVVQHRHLDQDSPEATLLLDHGDYTSEYNLYISHLKKQNLL